MIDVIDKLISKFTNFVYDTYYLNIDYLLISFFIAIGMALIVMLVELSYVGFDESSLKRVLKHKSKSNSIDIFYFIIHTSSLITLFAVLVSFGIPQSISTIVKSMISLDLGFELNIYFHLVIFLLLVDFMNYWQHRLMHKISFLWEIHKLHHSAEEFNVITVFREHPLDKAINSIFMIIPGVLLGNPVGEFAIFVTIYGIIGYVQHSKIPWHGFIGKYIIQSPRDHWIHHSKLKEHHDKNFGSTFAFWDHIFGTYYHGSSLRPILGLNDTNINKINPIKSLIYVQKRFFNEFIKLLKF